MEKAFAGPEQLIPSFVNVGVTWIIAATGELPVLIAVKEISPEPFASRPMPGALFVHE
jgi:hypothetical protein